MLIPKNLYYTRDHLWLRKIGQYDFYIGLTDFAQKEIGEISLIEITAEGSSIKKDKEWGSIYGINQTFNLISPFDCKIMEINTELDKKIEFINTDSYNYWLAILEVKNFNGDFLSNQEYIKIVQ